MVYYVAQEQSLVKYLTLIKFEQRRKEVSCGIRYLK